MPTITIPAQKARQGNLVLYTASVKVRDLVSDGFYDVKVLDPKKMEDGDYQRIIEPPRAKKTRQIHQQWPESGRCSTAHFHILRNGKGYPV